MPTSERLLGALEVLDRSEDRPEAAADLELLAVVAAPHTTGLLALVLGKHPGLTPFQLKAVLHAPADNAAGSHLAHVVGGSLDRPGADDVR